MMPICVFELAIAYICCSPVINLLKGLMLAILISSGWVNGKHIPVTHMAQVVHIIRSDFPKVDFFHVNCYSYHYTVVSLTIPTNVQIRSHTSTR